MEGAVTDQESQRFDRFEEKLDRLVDDVANVDKRVVALEVEHKAAAATAGTAAGRWSGATWGAVVVALIEAVQYIGAHLGTWR